MPPTAAPEVSVIVPCFNVAATIAEQLEALASQRSAPAFEVLLVDNRSSDDLRGAAARYIESEQFRVRVVSAEEHQGTSYARNVGIREAEADLLMFCDGDDVVGEWWVHNGLEAFKWTPLWSGAIVPLDDAIFEDGIAAVRCALDESKGVAQVEDSQHTAFPILAGGNFGATRDALLAIGGFDQSLPTQGEDNDIGFRARRLGFRVEVASGVKVGYRARRNAATRARLNYGKARAHALIAARYSAWSESHYNRWWLAPLRWLFDGLTLLFIRSPEEIEQWTVRGGTVRGFFTGATQYKILRIRPKQRIGQGWLDRIRPDDKQEGS